MKKPIHSFCLLASGLNLQTNSMIVPFKGFIVGVTFACVHNTVTSGAEMVSALLGWIPAAAAEFDGSASGKTNIYAVVRQRAGVADATSIAYSAINLFVPLYQPVEPRNVICLAHQMGTNGGVSQAIVQLIQF